MSAHIDVGVGAAREADARALTPGALILNRCGPIPVSA